jgi:hypothetical protein
MQLSRSRGKIGQGVPSSRARRTATHRPRRASQSASASRLSTLFFGSSISGRGPEPIGKAPPTYAGAAAPLIGSVTSQAATGRLSPFTSRDDRSPRSTRSYEVVKFVAQSGDHFTPRERGRVWEGALVCLRPAPIASNSSGRSPQGARFIDGCRSELTNNNGRWIVAPHEADVSALSMNALVRGKPVPACYFSRRSLTRSRKRFGRSSAPGAAPSHPAPHAREGWEGATAGSHPRAAVGLQPTRR